MAATSTEHWRVTDRHTTHRAGVLAAVRALAPMVRAHADEVEQSRRLPASVFEPLVEAGMFHLLTPRRFGGREVNVLTALEAIETFAIADGSTAWVLMINNNGGMISAYLDPEAAAELYHDNPRAVIGGALVPSGTATTAPGGYRVSGRWGFASGIEHCAWVMAACRVDDGEVRAVVLPGGDVTVLDTWSVGGLRGTGSHDFVVEGASVPWRRSFWLSDRPTQPGPLYRFPLRSFGAAAIAAVTLGVARGALDTLAELAGAKTPTMTALRLRDRPYVQSELARAEAVLRSARSWLYESVRQAWIDVVAGRHVTPRDQALLRLAATFTVERAAEAVDIAHRLAGGSAVYTHSPLERAFRDVHTATQHFSVQPTMYEPVGRALLHLPPADGLPL
jgi:alkylation response protein AidB-like acyl-CoA dehydrogenase